VQPINSRSGSRFRMTSAPRSVSRIPAERQRASCLLTVSRLAPTMFPRSCCDILGADKVNVWNPLRQRPSPERHLSVGATGIVVTLPIGRRTVVAQPSIYRYDGERAARMRQTQLVLPGAGAMPGVRKRSNGRELLSMERLAMTNTHFAVGQVLFREGDPADSVFRLLRGAVDIFRELDGEPILLGSVGAGQFIGEMGVVENRPRSATARAASQVEVEILTAAEFFDQIASSPPAARELIRRLSQRLREADDRIVNDERRNGRALVNWNNADSQTAEASVSNAYVAAKHPWLQRQLHTPLALSNLPFVVGRAPVAGEELPLLPLDLKLDDTPPFRLSRNHLMVEKRGGSYHVHDLRSTLGTIVNGEPIGTHFRIDDAPLRAGENEVIAGGVDSPFVFSVYLG